MRHYQEHIVQNVLLSRADHYQYWRYASMYTNSDVRWPLLMLVYELIMDDITPHRIHSRRVDGLVRCSDSFADMLQLDTMSIARGINMLEITHIYNTDPVFRCVMMGLTSLSPPCWGAGQT